MPSAEFLVASVIDGLMIGLVYAVAAVGLTLIFGVMSVVNLAHGAIITTGMFAVFVVTSATGMSPYLALLIAAVIGFALGVTIYWGSIHHLLDAPELTTLLATFAISIMLVGIGTAVFSTTPRNVAVSLGVTEIGPIRVLNTNLVAGAISLVLVGGLSVFLYGTRRGKMIQAVADNRAGAELVGIPSAWVLASAFGIGTLLAVSSGALIATLFPFTVFSGGIFELKSFVIVVLGGLGNVKGALIASLILGLIEGLVPAFMSVGWTPVIEFTIFVLVLVIRPQGLFGASDRVAA